MAISPYGSITVLKSNTKDKTLHKVYYSSIVLDDVHLHNYIVHVLSQLFYQKVLLLLPSLNLPVSKPGIGSIMQIRLKDIIWG